MHNRKVLTLNETEIIDEIEENVKELV